MHGELMASTFLKSARRTGTEPGSIPGLSTSERVVTENAHREAEKYNAVAGLGSP